jgi:predicted hotdog family 3-hydroxylacyl-ACP dehydratase
MSYPTVANLLPHRPPMRLIDAILDEKERGLVCRVVIRDDFPFLERGEAELVVCVELIAQSVGCFTGLVDQRNGKRPRPGLLVGCRDARFAGDPLRRGDDLTVTIETRWVREPVACFLGRVDRASARIASAEVTVIAIDDVAAVMEAMNGD